MKQPTRVDIYNPKIATLFIRVGLAIVFAYAAIDAFITPNAWIGYIPKFSNTFIDPKLALDMLSASQLVLVAWLLWGKFQRYAAILAAAFIAGLMVFNLDTFLITFRDVGLIGAAGGLFFLSED